MSGVCQRCGASQTAGGQEVCACCLWEGEPQPVELGPLELIEEIGAGGMGSVWKARHRRLGRWAAVKFLPAELEGQPEFKIRFEREARMMAMLNHPNIVGVHDFGQDEGRSYLVMEFVEGDPLSRRIPMGVPEAVDTVLQVCDALAYAHRQGIVHRDIKPENILVTADGHVKVTDFGIARLAVREQHSGRLTETGVAIGTPHYMSPEALEAALPAPTMDVYSLGVVLYELVMGRRPVGSFPPLPGALDKVVRKALAPDPADRYPTAAEFREALKGVSVAAGALPPEENVWIYAVAMLQSISTAVAIWAFLTCFTPKMLAPGDRELMISIHTEKLPDGREWSRARFELWPTIAALATFALAITPYGFLRRHWRLEGLEEDRGARAVPESRLVLVAGAAALVLYGVRHALEAAGQKWVRSYIEPVGAMVLVAVLFFFWVAVLSAWRSRRPLAREPRLWVGFGLSLVPPVIELIGRLSNWTGGSP